MDCEEGPFDPKGKEVDPHNWGNTDLDESDLDPEAQKEGEPRKGADSTVRRRPESH